MKHECTCVYMILNVVNGKAYVGSTNSFHYRKIAHIYALNKGTHFNVHLQNAWDKYGSSSFSFFIIAEATDRTRFILESWFIKSFQCQYNVVKEIDLNGMPRHSVQTIERMSASRRGKKQKIEHVAKRAAALIGRKYSAAHRAAISDGKKGVKFTDAHRDALRRARIGKSLSAAAKLKLSLANTGKTLSAEHKRKIRESNKRTYAAKVLNGEA